MAEKDKENAKCLLRIRNLQQELERSQLRYKELLKENEYLKSKSRSMEKDKNDIVEYLQWEVAAEERKVQEFREMLERQGEASDQAIEALKVEQRGEVEQVQKKIEGLSLENESLASAHSKRMEELQAELRSAEKQQFMEETRREATLLILKNKQNLEKKRSLEKLEKKIEDELMVALGITKQRNNHMQRLKVQNLLMEDNKVLLKVIDDLRREHRRTTSEVNDLMETLRSATAENVIHQKEVKKMWKWYEKLRSEVTERRISHEKQQRHQQAQIDALRRRLESASGRLQKKKAQASHLEAELQVKNSRSCRR